MKTENINNWMQILTSVGVILSLIFVGLQIQQSREIAIADIYQQRTALLLQQISLVIPPEEIHKAWSKERAGELLSPDDEFAVYIRTASRIAYWENNHFQYQFGLLAEEQWNASKNSIRIAIMEPTFLDVWELERGQVRKSFADAIDEIMAEETSK